MGQAAKVLLALLFITTAAPSVLATAAQEIQASDLARPTGYLENAPPLVRRVIAEPTLAAVGPPESFRGSPALYHWLLDHPDQAMRAWRRLGARCREIRDVGNGMFIWTDGEGTTLRWETVYRDGQVRVWYAEGTSRPSLLVPAIPVRAVVVMHHGVTRDAGERPILQHRAELYLQTDSRTAQWVARLLGPSAPRMAEQGLAQMEMFFSALVGILERYPHQLTALRDS